MSADKAKAPKGEPRGITELVAAGLGVATAVTIGDYADLLTTDKDHRGRILNRLRKAGRERKHVGKRLDGNFAYVYFVFDKWVMAADTIAHEPIKMDTLKGGGGKTRADGRRRLIVYADPKKAEVIALLAALDTITGSAAEIARYANDTRGVVWLTVSEHGQLVETVVPEPAK